jgi:hypothetical protein
VGRPGEPSPDKKYAMKINVIYFGPAALAGRRKHCSHLQNLLEKSSKSGIG